MDRGLILPRQYPRETSGHALAELFITSANMDLCSVATGIKAEAPPAGRDALRSWQWRRAGLERCQHSGLHGKGGLRSRREVLGIIAIAHPERASRPR